MRASLTRNWPINVPLNLHWFFFNPENVIKEGRLLLPGSRENFLSNNLKKICKTTHFEGIHDQFWRDVVFRRRIIENNRDEKVWQAWEIYHLSYVFYRNSSWLHLNKSGKDTQPLRKRSDFQEALSTLQRLHQEAEREQIERVPCWQYKQ